MMAFKRPVTRFKQTPITYLKLEVYKGTAALLAPDQQ